MNGRSARWLVVVGVGAGTFAVVWWVSEVLFRLDRSTAVTIAAAAASLVATPSAWWASQTATGSGPASSPTPAPGAGTAVTAPDSATDWRARLPAVVGVAVVVIACFVAVQAYGLLGRNGGASGQDPRGSATSPGGGAGGQQTVEVNKTAWFAGYKLVFGRVTYDRGRDPQLIVEAMVENLAPGSDYFTADMTFSSGGRHAKGFVYGSSLVPGGLKAELSFEFDPGTLTESLADGVLTFGDGTRAQTVVPLGGGPGLVAHEPRQVLGPTKVTHRDLDLQVRTCEVRADIVPEHLQSRAEHLVLACWVDATFTGTGSVHVYNQDTYRLRLPDGTTIGPVQYPITTLDPKVTKPQTYVAFSIPEPVGGAYVLQIVDRHSSTEPESPTTIGSVPLTL